jgi:apolipoprotein N-acyltransferase
MRKKNQLILSIGILLAAGLCYSSSAFAQKAEAKSTAKTAQAPVVRQLKNLNQPRRQAAMDELAASIEARMKTQPQYRAYIKSVDQHNKNAEAWAKAHKGGAR